MATPLELQRDTDWAAYEAGYNAARQQAIDDMVCFCRCGCQQPVEALGAWGAPARCPACRKGDQSKHSLMPRPVETFDWARYEPAEPPKPTRQSRAPISGAHRREAEAYVRKAGHHGFKTLNRMYARLVARGEPLTDAQAAAALRAKAADERAEQSMYRRSTVGERRASRKMDINGVAIGDDIAAGSYAVKDDHGQPIRVVVKRPVTGPLAGFVVVTLRYGDGIERKGVQYPGPRQAYRGEGAHLVARLVSNPADAKALFELASEVEAA